MIEEEVLAKSFCRTKFGRSFCFGGGSSGEVFGEVCGEVFGEVFGLVLLGHSEQKKTSVKTSGPNSHDSAQQSWQKFSENFLTRFCRGTPPKEVFQNSCPLTFVQALQGLLFLSSLTAKPPACVSIIPTPGEGGSRESEHCSKILLQFASQVSCRYLQMLIAI